MRLNHFEGILAGLCAVWVNKTGRADLFVKMEDKLRVVNTLSGGRLSPQHPDTKRRLQLTMVPLPPLQGISGILSLYDGCNVHSKSERRSMCWVDKSIKPVILCNHWW